MSIPEKEEVISKLQEHLGITFQKFQGKQIVYTDCKRSDTIILTPDSKVHVNDHGWVDILFQADRAQNISIAVSL